jgi:hypothetical protein
VSSRVVLRGVLQCLLRGVLRGVLWGVLHGVLWGGHPPCFIYLSKTLFTQHLLLFLTVVVVLYTWLFYIGTVVLGIAVLQAESVLGMVGSMRSRSMHGRPRRSQCALYTTSATQDVDFVVKNLSLLNL